MSHSVQMLVWTLTRRKRDGMTYSEEYKIDEKTSSIVGCSECALRVKALIKAVLIHAKKRGAKAT